MSGRKEKMWGTLYQRCNTWEFSRKKIYILFQVQKLGSSWTSSEIWQKHFSETVNYHSHQKILKVPRTGSTLGIDCQYRILRQGWNTIVEGQQENVSLWLVNNSNRRSFKLRFKKNVFKNTMAESATPAGWPLNPLWWGTLEREHELSKNIGVKEKEPAKSAKLWGNLSMRTLFWFPECTESQMWSSSYVIPGLLGYEAEKRPLESWRPASWG